MIMASFAMSSYTQTFDCLHENPASLLETREEFCVECSLEAEGSSIEAALELHANLRCEQENEPAQSLDVTNDDGFGHKWTNRDGELKEQVYDIGNRLPSWLFLDLIKFIRENVTSNDEFVVNVNGYLTTTFSKKTDKWYENMVATEISLA